MPTTPELTSSETSPASDIAYDQHAVSTPNTTKRKQRKKTDKTEMDV